MSVRLEIAGECLDELEGFSLRLDLMSPIYNEKGSQSSALTLPATRRNRRLLGYPDRLDLTQRRDVLDCYLTDGPLRRLCRLNILSACPDGIEVSIGTDESLMYESWQDRRLRDIPSLPVYIPDGDTPEERVASLIALMDDIYRRNADDSDFRVFPVALEFEDIMDGAGSDAMPRAVILNRLLRDDTKKNDEDDLLGTALDTDERLMEQGLQSDSLMHVPEGYGVSPFLRLSRFLHILFEAFGYNLLENIFDTDPQLSEMVLLNNTMDCICAGSIDYRDLLPSCSVNELLECLRARFGAVFYLDASTREARCVLLRDSLSLDADLDLTLNHESRPITTIETPRQLSLRSQTSYQRVSAEENDLASFLSKYQEYIDLYPTAGHPALLFDRFTQSFYRDSKAAGVRLFMSSLHYPWERKDKGFETLEIASNDECLPLYSYRGTGDMWGNVAFNLAALPLFLSGVRNAHTAVKTSSALNEDDTLERDTDLALCFAHGMFVTNDGLNYGLYYGSPYSNRPDGQHYVTPAGDEFTYSLTYEGMDGCYNRFMRPYDRVLRHSDRQIETTMRLDRSTLSRLDLSRMKLFFGQKVLIDSMELVLPLSLNLSRTTRLRTTRILDPTDSTPDALTISRSEGYWAVTSDLAYIQSLLLSDVRGILASQYDSYEITSIRFENYEKNIPSSLKQPTHEEILSHKTITYTYKTRLYIEYKYRNASFFLYQKGTGTFPLYEGIVTEEWEAVAYPTY